MRKHALLIALILFRALLTMSEEPDSWLRFEPTVRSFETLTGMVISQRVSDTDRFNPGAVLIRLPNVDVSTLRGGVLLGRVQDGSHIVWLKLDEYAVGTFSIGKPEVAILPFEGWERGSKYAVRLHGTVRSTAGIPFTEGTWLVSIDKQTPLAAPAGNDPVKAIRFSSQESFFRTASGQHITQTVVDRDRKQAGVVYVTLSNNISRDTIVGSVDLGRFVDGKPIWLQPQEYAVGLVDTRKPLMAMFPYKGWSHGAEYVFRFRDTETGLAGNPIADHGAAWVIDIPEEQPGPPPAPKKAQTSLASAGALGDRFPGGQNLLFQGAWTDPASGLAYHRGRWYDPKTGAFLSEDPKGAIDSENLYAFGQSAPHLFTDPMGTQTAYTYHLDDKYGPQTYTPSEPGDASNACAGALLGCGKVLAAPGILTYNLTGAILHITTGGSQYLDQYRASAGMALVVERVAEGGLPEAGRVIGEGFIHGGRQLFSSLENDDAFGAGEGLGDFAMKTFLLTDSVNSGMASASQAAPLYLVTEEGIAFSVIGTASVEVAAATGPQDLLILMSSANDVGDGDSGVEEKPRRSSHAEERGRQGRSTGTAFNDAQKVTNPELFFQELDKRFIVRLKGKGGREHIFESNGDLVTTINKRSKSAHQSLMQKGERRIATPGELKTFRKLHPTEGWQHG